MDICSNSFLVLRQKARYMLGQVWGEEVSVLQTQTLIDGTDENHVELIFNKGGGATLQTSALMAGGLDGLRQVAFPFNAKVMAAGSEPAQSNAMLAISHFMQVGCRQHLPPPPTTA